MNHNVAEKLFPCNLQQILFHIISRGLILGLEAELTEKHFISVLKHAVKRKLLKLSLIHI